MGKKIVIVGGVAGGATTAARLRRLDETAEIIMIERGNYVSFANCGLPYYIGDVINDRERLLVQTVDNMQARFNIDIRVNSEVIKVTPNINQITVKKADQTYTMKYDYLVLAPGAKPIVPNLPGIDNKLILTLRNMEDTDQIKTFIQNNKPKSVAVIGGGFIGVEMAENLKHLGLEVTLVEGGNQILNFLDLEMARMVETNLTDNGSKIIKEKTVQGFEDNQGLVVKLTDEALTVDFAILAIGVKPETNLALDAKLELGSTGGILVNEYLQTSVENIYAVGDAIQVKNLITNQDTLLAMAGPANRQARIVANNICGKGEKYGYVQGSAIVKIFDSVVAATGANEKVLAQNNIPYLTSFTTSSHHAGYYPGAESMVIKLIFTPNEGKILGAQIYGKTGVDKRIDVIATGIKMGIDVKQLTELELAYAPPFSSAKDPVNMAGYAAMNILNEDILVCDWEEIKSDDYVLDVRTKLEYDLEHYPGAINIEVDELRSKLTDIPKDKRIIVYCKVGLRGYIAARILMANHYNVLNVKGGFDLYQVMHSKQDKQVIVNDEMTDIKTTPVTSTIKVDACGLQCPGPLMKVYQTINTVNDGDVLEVHATDDAFVSDIKAWCEHTGNALLSTDKINGEHVVLIKKGSACNLTVPTDTEKGKTIIVFDGDLDKALAAFIIANGASTLGKPVTMFFTFWGLNVLRKAENVKVKKNLVEKMFGFMLPRGSKELTLSKMNMGGMGTKMMREIMKYKHVESLEELIQDAINNGVKLVACSMSMDIMGIKAEELMDGVELGGVGYYLGEAEDSNVNLFI